MTRAQISDGLRLLVESLANPAAEAGTPEGWTPHEWAYIKGVASGELLRLRDRLIAAGRLEDGTS